MSGFGHVAVVGGGLIGGSAARRLAAVGADVVVVDPDAATRSAAEAAGLRTAATPDGALADADLVVLACPLDVMPAAMAAVAAATSTAVVVDVGSVKGAVLAAAEEAGLAGRFVGCHPMSGTEHSGFGGSDADLLVGATWAVVPGRADAAAVTAVVAWLTDAFAATVVVLDADRHDRAVALVSHLPHALANTLLGVAARDGDAVAGLLAAGSMRDGTRVAGRNTERTLNMLTENRAELGRALDAAIAELRAYRRDLDDVDALRDRLAAVTGAGARFRDPSPDWARCDDLAAALAGASGPLAVRRSAEDVDVHVVAVLEDRAGGGVG